MLERAKCYALLGQRKTAIYDFSAILKENPKHVQALCGRGFTYLMLNQQKVKTWVKNWCKNISHCTFYMLFQACFICEASSNDLDN